MNEGKLKAVHDDDIEKLLESLECLENVKAGGEKCYFCGETISIDNIAAVFPKDDLVCFCCSAEECYRKLLESEV